MACSTQFNMDEDRGGPSVYEMQEKYNENMIREQPYYRYGMSKEEAVREEEYMNLCIESNPMMFFEGKYTPLWKQNLYR